jgi:hypothetical protein
MGISELKQLQPFAGSMVSSQRMRTQVLTTLLTLGVAAGPAIPRRPPFASRGKSKRVVLRLETPP